MSKEKSWGNEVDKRPAPVILACLSGLCVMFASVSSLKPLYGIAVIIGLYSLQITIWRSAFGVEPSERGKG